MSDLTPALWSLPWILPQIVTYFRLRNSRSLDAESAVAPPHAPLVSVIVPARNEAHNIERCVRSILTTTYPRLELIVVDDSSTDGTANAARDAAQGDSRFRIVNNPPLPEGWFGKQWACNTGAAAARGEILLFTDADTHHAGDLVSRSVNAMQRTGADMFSVAGRQEMGGFWEKIMQPQIFSILSMRYGGTESVNDSPRVSEKIANGQCIFFTRAAYDAIGGHSSVRSVVAEDLMLAQTAFARGKKLVLMLGVDQLSTRMYASLRELMEGWGKNVFAAGLDSVPFGRVGRIAFPLLLLAPPLMQLLPLIVLVLAAFGAVGGGFMVWAVIATTATLVWWIGFYAQTGESPLYALAYPLGAAVLLYLFSRAIVRGRRVTWKGRTYVSRSVLSVVFLLAAISVDAQSPRAPEACTREYKALVSGLPALMDSAGIPGIALALIEAGTVADVRGVGRADSLRRVSGRRTVFEAASLSKPVIAYAALKLVDAGKLDLDRPLTTYRRNPDFHGDPRADLVTARMVLNHTTGLQNERIGTDSLKFSFTPGVRYQYSGEGYVVLGRVIEAITRTSLATAMRRLVFQPLGMNRSSFVWEQRFASDAAIGHGRFSEPRRPTRPLSARAPSSLHTTASDYALFLRALLNGTGLKPSTLRLMIRPAIEISPGVAWGLGWAIETGSRGVSLAHHGDNSNSGFTSFALLDVGRRCGLVYFANSVNGLSIVREMARAISGSHPAPELLTYERYSSPGSLTRTRVAHALRTRSIEDVLTWLRELRVADTASAPERLLNDLGYVLLAQGRPTDAVRVFTENTNAFPGSGNAYDSLGDAYLALGDAAAAGDAFERAWTLDPRNARARRLADSLSTAIKR